MTARRRELQVTRQKRNRSAHISNEHTPLVVVLSSPFAFAEYLYRYCDW